MLTKVEIMNTLLGNKYIHVAVLSAALLALVMFVVSSQGGEIGFYIVAMAMFAGLTSTLLFMFDSIQSLKDIAADIVAENTACE